MNRNERLRLDSMLSADGPEGESLIGVLMCTSISGSLNFKEFKSYSDVVVCWMKH